MILLTQNGCLEVTPRWLPSSKTFFYRDFGLSHIKEEIPLEQTIKWLCKQGVWESFLLLFWFCASLLFRIHWLRIFIHIQLQCQVFIKKKNYKSCRPLNVCGNGTKRNSCNYFWDSLRSKLKWLLWQACSTQRCSTACGLLTLGGLVSCFTTSPKIIYVLRVLLYWLSFY